MTERAEKPDLGTTEVPEKVRRSIRHFIGQYDNQKRRHSANRYESPNDFELAI